MMRRRGKQDIGLEQRSDRAYLLEEFMEHQWCKSPNMEHPRLVLFDS